MDIVQILIFYRFASLTSIYHLFKKYERIHLHWMKRTLPRGNPRSTKQTRLWNRPPPSSSDKQRSKSTSFTQGTDQDSLALLAHLKTEHDDLCSEYGTMSDVTIDTFDSWLSALDNQLMKPTLAENWYSGDSPFETKDELKERGARWHWGTKKWCAANLNLLIILSNETPFCLNIPNYDTQTCIDWVGELQYRKIVVHQAKRLRDYRQGVAQSKGRKENRTQSVPTTTSSSIPNTQTELDKLVRAYAIGELHINYCDTLDIGPRLGMSPAGRVLRALELGTLDVSSIQQNCKPYATVHSP